MATSYIILDNSGSMYRSEANARIIAEGCMNGANADNRIGFISFNDRVTVCNYFENHPQPLVDSLRKLAGPRGSTELADAMLTALCIDATKPDSLFIISDDGENSSEVNLDVVRSMLVDARVVAYWIKPPVSGVIIPPFLVEPPIKVKLLDKLEGIHRVDLSKMDERKLMDSVNKIRMGQVSELVAR